ncbi:MAG TPA: nuclear transport factor 2 family protein [Ktedonobacterales bacterium]
MNAHKPSPKTSTRILLVVADALLRETLSDILREEGYVLRHATSLAQASSLLSEETFGLVLTELLDVRLSDPLQASAALVRQASPTPVGIVTGWNVTDEAARNAGFAFCLFMPFELETLLAHVAGAMRAEMTPEQEQQAEVARSYLTALSEGRLDDALALCTETIRYHLPNNAPPASGPIHDKASLRAYAVDALSRYPDARFEDVNIYALPGRLAARYTMSWNPTQERERAVSGALVFRFEGERIAEVGVKYDAARVNLANAHPAMSEPQEDGTPNGQDAAAT